jgi:hypothetical protein
LRTDSIPEQNAVVQDGFRRIAPSAAIVTAAQSEALPG